MVENYLFIHASCESILLQRHKNIEKVIQKINKQKLVLIINIATVLW